MRKNNIVIKMFMLLLLATVSLGMASATVGVSIVPSQKNVNVGDSFSLDIQIDPAGSTVAGANVDINFDSSVLQVASVNLGSFLPQTLLGAIDNSAGTIKNYGEFCIASGCGTTALGTFMTVNFQAIANGSSQVNIVGNGKAIVSDTNGTELPSSLSNGIVTSTAKDQTITFDALANKILGDAPFVVSATASSGLPVSFSIVSGPATILGSTVTITGVGTVTVRASQAGNATYNAAPNVDQSFTVNPAPKKDQTITFGALSNKIYGDIPFVVTATASSGLPVSFSILSGPATISGSTVTLTGVGTVTIRASQAGNATYNPAPNVDRTFTVNAQTNGGKIQGEVFNDLNHNKKLDKGEPGIKGVVIQLTGNDKNTKKIKLETKTDKNGNYIFSNLPNGQYVIHAETTHGWSYTTSTSKEVTIKNGNVVTVNFGERYNNHH